MPQIDGLGHSRHRFQIGQGLYTSSDIERGRTPTPSQIKRGLSDTGLDARWFALPRPKKQLWQNAANLIEWQDFGTTARSPSGRQLYNRLNRSRHIYATSTGGGGGGGVLPTVDTPPGPAVQQPELSALLVTSQAPGATGFGALTFEYCQQAYFPPGGGETPVNPAQRSFGHQCEPGSYERSHLVPGVDVTFVATAPYWRVRGYHWPIMVEAPDLAVRMFTSNAIAHYDSTFGSLQVGFSAIAANVYIELLWDRTNLSTDGPLRRWQTLVALPNGIQAQGGNAMPTYYADQPSQFAVDTSYPYTTPSPDVGLPQPQAPPNDGLNDLKFAVPWFPQVGCAGAVIKIRAWSFDEHGWPGSKYGAVSTILPAPVPLPLPPCPP